MTDEPSPRPWRVEASQSQGKFWICQTTLGVSIGETWKESDARLIVDAVNLKTLIDEAMADEAGYLHPVVLDGKPIVCVTPPPSEAEELRMHLEYETSLLVDRERFRRGYYEAEERIDRLCDIVREMANTLEHISNEHRFDFYELVREARAAIGEDKP